MAQFDFLDNVKNTLVDQFQPETARAGAELPPGLGDVPQAPELGLEGGGLESFLPPEEEFGGIPEAENFPAPEAADVPTGLGSQITLSQLLGFGLDSLLENLLSQASPTAGIGGGFDATQGQQPGV